MSTVSTKLGHTNPDYNTLISLFVSKGWDTATSLARNDPDLESKGFYSKYSTSQLAYCFRQWKERRVVSRDSSEVEISTSLDNLCSPVKDLVNSVVVEAYFADKTKQPSRLWADVANFVEAIQTSAHFPMLEALRSAIIGAVAKRAAATSTQLTRRGSTYLADLLKIREEAATEFVRVLRSPSVPSATTPSTTTPMHHTPSSLSASEIRSRSLFLTFVSSYEAAMASSLANTSLPNLTELLVTDFASLDAIRKQCSARKLGGIGYVAGWLLFAIGKRSSQKGIRKSWRSIVIANTLPTSVTTDYTSKLSRVSIGNLVFPGFFFFRFVFAIEVFFNRVLDDDANLVAYGERLLQAVHSVTQDCSFLRQLAVEVLTPVSTDGSPSMRISSEEVGELVGFCSFAYCRMRGKDIVRRLLGRKTKKQAGLAVVSFRAGLAVGAKSSMQHLEEEMTAFAATVDTSTVDEDSGEESYASCYDDESDDDVAGE